MALNSLPEKELWNFGASEEKLVNTQVEVKVMDMRWLLRGDKNFLDFVPILESYPLDKLY